MPSLNRRRRMRRRRVKGPLVATVVVAIVVVGLLLGSLAEVGVRSGPYDRAVDRSFAVQARTLVEQSGWVAVRLHQLLALLPAPKARRSSVQWSLDALVTDTESQSGAADALATPSPVGDAASLLAAVFADRSQAMATLRTAIDGLLGMAPSPGPPVPGTSGTAAAHPTARSAAWATSKLVSAGTLLERADRDYAELRRDLAGAPGHPHLPPSAWVSNGAAWGSATVSTLVSEVAGSAALAPVHRLVLVAPATRLDPGALPPAPTAAGAPAVAAGVSVIPPTSWLTVTAVVADDGNVAEEHVQVTASLQPQGASTSSSVRALVSVAGGGAVTATLPRLAVQAGTTYTLTVAVQPPAGQADRSGLTQQVSLEVAATASSSPPSTG